MYKLIALDIDDTLLSLNLQLSNANRDAIRKASEAGVFVTLATGRIYGAMKEVCAQIGLHDMPVITLGGAKIQQYPSKEVLYERTMSESLVMECIAFAQKQNVCIECYQDDTFYYQKPCSEIRFHEARTGYQGVQRDFMSLKFSNTTNCVMIAEPFVIDKLIPLARATFGDKLQVMRSSSRIMEFYPPGTNKGQALAWLAEGLGVRQEEVLAMGDSSLDIPMLEYAGMGVAVSNAEQDLINIANYVAPHADSNAVAHVIHKYVLGD